MNPWPSLLVCLIATALCSGAGAEELYPFSGRIDFPNQIFSVSIGQNDKRASFDIQRNPDHSYGLDFQSENFPALFFDMTTHLKGVVRLEKNDLTSEKLSGRLWEESTGHSFINTASRLEFEIDNEVLSFSRFVWGGIQGDGHVSVKPPYSLDVHLALQETDVIRFLNWICGTKKNIHGTAKVNADVMLSGNPSKLSVKANISSEQGNIEKFFWDLLALHVQGIYPVLEISNSTITKTNGLSFDLEGVINLNHKDNLAGQLKAIKKIPLIKENALQSQWVLKRVGDSQVEGKTETKFFLKKDKKSLLAEQDDTGLFGMEKKIGF